MTPFIKEARLVDITKRFHGVNALKSVSIDLHAGQVVGLVGENGAGKSTLIKILSGALIPSSGRIWIDRKEVILSTPRDSEKAGIRTIYQELNLCSHLSVAENIMLGNEPRYSQFFRSFIIDRRTLNIRAKQILDDLAVSLPLDRSVERLTIAEQQLVEICKSLVGNASFLVMDEPTSSLSGREVTRLLDLIHRLRASGRLILFVSHRLEEVLSVADRVIVLRDGSLVGQLDRAQAERQKIIQLMLGRNLEAKTTDGRTLARAAPMLTVKNLITASGRPPVSFVLSAGEIVCLAGLVGSGRSSILHCIFHSKRAIAGEVILRGQPLTAIHPRGIVRRGVGFVPEDRKTQGVILQMSVAKNLTLPALQIFTRYGLIDRGRERRRVKELIAKYMIRVPSADAPVGNLSGGNQQKVVLAKWFSLRPYLLLVDEPTRGVDVAGRAEIHDMLRRMAESGIGILMVSSEIEEVIQVATRVLVISDGKITRELLGGEISEGNIIEGALPAT